ncbi:MAG: CBS domain-containing protein [Salaquimonas sp.]
MTVAAILSNKGGSVVTATPTTTLQEISATLTQHKIGAIVTVEPDGSVCGIASERDVVRQIADKGPDALSMPVSSCMTKTVIACKTSDTIDHVMGIMSTKKFRHMPVIEDGKLLGIISIGDVVKRKIESAEREAEELKQYIAG